MRILITNNSLAARAGSELYVRDLAIELARRGHRPVAYSTWLGEVAKDLRAASVPVIDSLSSLGEAPDIIHGHHHLEAATAMLHFPGVPAIHYCHGWIPWQEVPLHSPQIRRYVAVSRVCRERLIAESGIAPSHVEVIGNFFDERIFPPRLPLPQCPRAVLAFGNDFSEQKGIPQIREACASLGLELDVVGMHAGGFEPDPGRRLLQYDIVFAKGRAAIEALAVGTAVVLCNADRLGPLVTPRNFQFLRDGNFGLGVITDPLDQDHLVKELRGYNAEDAAEVSRMARSSCGLQAAADRLIDLYGRVLAEARSQPAPDVADVARAAGRYLEHWAPAYKQAVERQPSMDAWIERCIAAECSLERLRLHRDQLQERAVEADRLSIQAGQAHALLIERCNHAEGALRQLQLDYDRLLDALRAAEQRAEQLAEQRTGQLKDEQARLTLRLQNAESDLRAIRTSATWRWSQSFLNLPLMQWMFGRWIHRVASGSSERATTTASTGE